MSSTVRDRRAPGGAVALGGVLAQLVGPVAVVDELLGAGGDAGEVAVPEADELERVLERPGRCAALGPAGAVGELGLALAVLLLGQVLELLGERGLDLLLGGGAGAAGLVEQRAPGLVGVGAAVQRGARERLGAGAQLGAERERQRALAVAEREPRAGGGGLGVDPARLEPLRELGGGQRVEAHRLAARADGRQHLRGVVGQQQQDDVGRRLLERLEQRVGRLVVHRVGALEHEHAVGGLERRVRGGGHHRLLDVAPQHLVRAARRHPRQVGMRAVQDARARRLGVVAPAARRRSRARLRACRSRPGRAGGTRARGGRRARRRARPPRGGAGRASA